jgi:hypothetical protein
VSDRALGVYYLRFWWNATPMAVLQLTTFQDAEAYYDKQNPDFIAALGRNAAHVPADRVKGKFEEVAKQFGDKYPHYSYLLQAVVDAGGEVTAGDIASAAADGVVQAGKYLAFGIGGYMLIAGLVAVVLLAPELKLMLRRVKA